MNHKPFARLDPALLTLSGSVRRSLLSSLSILVFTLAALGQAPASSSQPTERDDRYRIGFQDILEIQVFRHPELTQRVAVNPNGLIFLPRLESPMSAACKTERELATDIAKQYESFLKNPFVTVIVAEQRSQSFGVIGSVEKPGSFFISRKLQLLELLALAGGPNKEAGSRLIVARTGSTSACNLGSNVDDVSFLNFRIRDVQEGKKSLWMKPGDIVSVLDSDLVYVYGSVRKPGEIRMKEPITLRQAIASAEGFASDAARDSIRLIRQKGDSGDWDEVSYSLKDIDKGRVKDPVLMPNDIVAVSGDPVKSILQGLSRSITGGISNLPVILR